MSGWVRGDRKTTEWILTLQHITHMLTCAEGCSEGWQLGCCVGRPDGCCEGCCGHRAGSGKGREGMKDKVGEGKGLCRYDTQAQMQKRK